VKHSGIALTGLFVLAITATVEAAGEDRDRYDSSKPVTVEGAVLTSTFEDPNATIAVDLGRRQDLPTALICARA
jgi:hypothetical protein